MGGGGVGGGGGGGGAKSESNRHKLCCVQHRLDKVVARLPGVTYCLLGLLTNSIKVRLRSVLIN